MRYFIKSLADVPECVIKTGYRSATCKDGYVELDPEKDIDLIRAYGAKEAPESKSAKAAVVKGEEEALEKKGKGK